MRAMLNTIVKRNAVIGGAVLVLLTTLSSLPLSSRVYALAGVIVSLGGLIGFCRASAPPGKQRRRLVAALLTVIVSLFLTGALVVGSLLIGQVVMASGITGMKHGCNLASLNAAQTSVYAVSNDLDIARQVSPADSNELMRLQAEYSAAKRRSEFWQRDVQRRGHSGWVPIRDPSQ